MITKLYYWLFINGWNYAHDVKLLHLDRALQCGLVQKRGKKPKLSCIQAVGGAIHALSHIAVIKFTQIGSACVFNL